MFYFILTLAPIAAHGRQTDRPIIQKTQAMDASDVGFERWLESIDESNFRQVVEQLISDITSVEKTNVAIPGLVAPYSRTEIASSSSFDPFLFINDGVFAAFAIECIFAQDMRCNSIRSPYYMNVIIPLKRETQLPELTMEHMREIQELYEQWWAEARQLSLARIKHYWNLGHRALSKSDSYRWD